jgi:hypothetical protein
VSISVD